MSSPASKFKGNQLAGLPAYERASSHQFIKASLLLSFASFVAVGLFYATSRELDHGPEHLNVRSSDRNAKTRPSNRESSTRVGELQLAKFSDASGSRSSGAADAKHEGYEYRSSAQHPESAYSKEMEQAIKLIDSGRFEEAVSILEAIIKFEPRNEQALVELAMVQLLDLKKPDAAIQNLERAVDVNPSNRLVASELVSLYEEQGIPDAGINFLNEQIAKHPESAELSFGLGQMLVNQGRDAEAVQYLEKASRSDDQKDRVLQDLGDAYARLNAGDRAIDAYRRSIDYQEAQIRQKREQDLETTFPTERLNSTKMDLAREYYRQRQYEQAGAIASEVQSRSPDDQGAQALLTQIKGTPKG